MGFTVEVIFWHGFAPVTEFPNHTHNNLSSTPTFHLPAPNIAAAFKKF